MKYDWPRFRFCFGFPFKEGEKKILFDFIDSLKGGIIPLNCLALIERFLAMWNCVSFNFCLRQGELSHLTQTFPGVHVSQKGGQEAEPPGFPISRGVSRDVGVLGLVLTPDMSRDQTLCRAGVKFNPGSGPHWSCFQLAWSLGADVWTCSWDGYFPFLSATRDGGDRGRISGRLGLSLGFPACLVCKSF